MDTFFLSTGIVALAEMGDKTQLLTLLLATRFRKALPIIIGILLATLINHALAGLLGVYLPELMSDTFLSWVLAIGFFAMAIWMLIPDSLEEESIRFPHFGVLLTTLFLFFMAEMGDKTQIATIALAAEYQAYIAVILGTTLGMMIANVPVIFFGGQLIKRVPLHFIHRAVAIIFFILGVYALIRALH